MANADAGNLTVAVETVVHEAIALVMAKIWQEHGIQVLKVQIEWTDISSLSKKELMVKSVRVKTITYPGAPK